MKFDKFSFRNGYTIDDSSNIGITVGDRVINTNEIAPDKTVLSLADIPDNKDLFVGGSNLLEIYFFKTNVIKLNGQYLKRVSPILEEELNDTANRTSIVNFMRTHVVSN